MSINDLMNIFRSLSYTKCNYPFSAKLKSNQSYKVKSINQLSLNTVLFISISGPLVSVRITPLMHAGQL